MFGFGKSSSRKKKTTSKKRRCFVESLETRDMFTATILIDFVDPGQNAAFGLNQLGAFDMSAFGMQASEYTKFQRAVVAEIREDFYAEIAGEVAAGRRLDIEFRLGNAAFPLAPDTHVIYVGSDLSQNTGYLGVGNFGSIRTAGGVIGNSGVKGAAFSNRIAGEQSTSAWTFETARMALSGVISNRIGFALSLSQVIVTGSSQPISSAKPIMAIGEADFILNDFISDKQFSKSAINPAQSNAQEQIKQLINVLGTRSFNGVGDTIGLYQNSTSQFHLKNSFSGGSADAFFGFGPGNTDQWLPLAGDWNGDGVDTIGLYNKATSTFHLKNSASGGNGDIVFSFGVAPSNWIPLAGDWNGDGIDTIGLFDPATANFHLKNSFTGGSADVFFTFGTGASPGVWNPIVGDWNGDGVDTIGLYRRTDSTFHLRNSLTGGSANEFFAFGSAGSNWIPIAGDWDANGVDTIGLYDPTFSDFHLKNSFAGGPADRKFQYGPTSASPAWRPLIGDWNGPNSVYL